MKEKGPSENLRWLFLFWEGQRDGKFSNTQLLVRVADWRRIVGRHRMVGVWLLRGEGDREPISDSDHAFIFHIQSEHKISDLGILRRVVHRTLLRFVGYAFFLALVSSRIVVVRMMQAA